MDDLAEAKILVTGATDGLGKHVAFELAASDATVLLHGRSRERLETTIEEIRRDTGNEKLGSYLADLSSLGEVRALAEQVLAEQDRLDVLINNAGVIEGNRRESEDGYELTFAVNYLACFLLTHLLLPLLRDSAPARVVNVASAGQSPVDFDDVMLDHGYDAMRAYTQSKLAQVMFAFELAERLGGRGDRAPGCLPGAGGGHGPLFRRHPRGARGPASLRRGGQEEVVGPQRGSLRASARARRG